jgi:uncharacterized protein YegL
VIGFLNRRKIKAGGVFWGISFSLCLKKKSLGKRRAHLGVETFPKYEKKSHQKLRNGWEKLSFLSFPATNGNTSMGGAIQRHD